MSATAVSTLARPRWPELPPATVREPVCPLCASPEIRVLDETVREGVRTLHCAGCTGLFTSPRLDATTLARYYVDDFDRYQAFTRVTTTGEVTSGDAQARARFITEAVGAPRGWRVVEIGAGGGEFLVLMTRLGAREGVGFEPALSAPTLTSGAVTLRQKVLRGPADFDEPAANVIALYHVLEHLVDPVAYLTRFRERLVPPGYVALELPNFYRYRFPDPEHFFRPIHLTNFTPRALRLAAARAGLFPVRWNRVAAKHLCVVLGTVRGRPLRRDNEGPSYACARAYVAWIRRFAPLERRLGTVPRVQAAARFAARAGARLLLGSVIP